MKNRTDCLSQSDKIVEYLLSVLKADENAEVHACVCIGLAKLLLSGMVTNTNVRARDSTPGCGVVNPSLIQALETIFLLYVTPETSDNLELRQCLSYFFPVYCYSNAENQRKVQEASRSARLFDGVFIYPFTSYSCPCSPRLRKFILSWRRVRRWSTHSNLLRCSSTGWTQKRPCR